MRNRHELVKLAEENGIAVKKRLKTWPKGGDLVVLEVDKSPRELADELRDLGVLR